MTSHTAGNVGIASWIRGRAWRNPRAVALIHDGERVSYGELHRRAMNLARQLVRCGVGARDRVGILATRDPLNLEVLIACAAIGAIGVCLHPGFSTAAMANALELSGAKVVVGTPHSARRLPAGARRWALITDAALWRRPASSAIGAEHTFEIHSKSAPAADDCALIAFSSGTSGLSKGVALSHGNLLWNAINILTCMDIRTGDVLLGSAPLYRMGGLGFALAMLLKGGTVVVPSSEAVDDSLALIEAHRVSVVFDSVQALVAMSQSPGFDTRDLSSLRVCATGGTLVPASLLRTYRRRGLLLQPGYGLTEAAPLALLLDPDRVEGQAGSVGRPPVFCAARVVDHDLVPVPEGVVGELLVQGPNVMLGYWRDPDATRAALVGGWLRTGDAASSAEDGSISIWGRIADALQLEGRRVHPGVAERALLDVEGVDDAVIVQGQPDGRPTVFAEASIAAATSSAMAEIAERELGVRVLVEVVNRLPRNPNGKVLRGPLRELSKQQVVSAAFRLLA